jgi:LacI family transcriptional regulator
VADLPIAPGTNHRSHATIGDVARLAGVSIATVSRVLNGTKHVSEPTATLVREAADRLSFRPSRSAQLLARRRPRLIGLVISDLLNETLLTWARAAAEEAAGLGYQTVLCDGRNSPDAEAEQLEQLLAARVDAICLVGPVAVPPRLRDRIVAAGTTLTPGFMHDRRAAGRVRAAAERAAIDAAVDLLATTGSTWIATVAAPLDAHADLVFDARRRAIERRARRHGLAVDASDHLGPDPADLRALLARRPGPGALVALNHDLPGAVVATVLACGRAIPDDVALVAFGDSRAARSWTPRTTVITRDMDSEARRHVRALVDHLEARGQAPGDRGDGPALTMERAELVERQTTRPRPAPVSAAGGRGRSPRPPRRSAPT